MFGAQRFGYIASLEAFEKKVKPHEAVTLQVTKIKLASGT